MITIPGIGLFDPAKKFEEQSEEVATSLMEIVSGFNDFNATERDRWNRPIQWQHVIDGMTIQTTRTYQTDDFNYFIESQENTIIDGNV